MRVHTHIVIAVLFASIVAGCSAAGPRIEVVGSISREDVREICRLVRAHTRERITRITSYDARGEETASSSRPITGVSVQTGDPLTQVTGGSYYLEKRRGGG